MDDKNTPLYSKIYNELKHKIATGVYEEEQQLPTELELADLYGVSRITSKRALLELERDKLIYRKRGSGSFVKKREAEVVFSEPSGKIISMILPYVAANGLLGYIQGATDYLDTKGYYLTIHTSHWHKDKEKEFLVSLPRRGVSGIILYPVSTLKNLDVIYSLHLNQFPLVTIDQYYDNVPVESVVSDNFDGGYSACKHLIELGHRRIAFVSSVGIEYRSSVRDRFYGYCQALKDAGLDIDSDLIIQDFYEQYDNARDKKFVNDLVQQLVALEVTAIQAEHDILAVDLVRSAVDYGIEVPGQLSVIGFDNHEISQNVEIPITTVEQNFYEIGRKAAEMILDQLAGKVVSPPRKEKINTARIHRQSTGANTTNG